MNIKTSTETSRPPWAEQPVTTRMLHAENQGDLLEGLRQLDQSCGPSNKHDRAIVLIHACIDQGANTRAQILALLTRLGFDRRHIAIIIKEGTGQDPARHRWAQGSDKRFHNLPDDERAPR